MVVLASIDHIRRPTLNPRYRAELYQRLTDLAQLLHEHDRAAVMWAEQRRRIFDEMQRTHDLLWDIDCFNGRQPPRPGEPPLPPTSEDPIYLYGRRLRTTCLAILARHGRQSLPELHTLVHLYGYAVANKSPGKALADAMAMEVREGRARRPERGHYEVTRGYRPMRRRRSAPPPMLHPVDPLLQWYPERWWPAEADDGWTDEEPGLGGLGGAEPGVEVGEDVVDRLEADRQAHELGLDAGGELLLGGELAVGGGGGVDGQAAHVADVGEVAVQLERRRRTRCPASAPPSMPNERIEPAPLRHVLLRARRTTGSTAGPAYADPLDLVAGLEPLGDRLGVGDVALHAQRQRLEALQEQERVERRDGGADVAQRCTRALRMYGPGPRAGQ